MLIRHYSAFNPLQYLNSLSVSPLSLPSALPAPRSGRADLSSTIQQLHTMTAGGQQWNSPEHERHCPVSAHPNPTAATGEHPRQKYSTSRSLPFICPLVSLAELQRCELCSPCPEVSHVSHNAWVGFQGKCYYFSDTESAWNISREHCQQLGASLATIDSKEEMEFVLRFRGPANCWIGLHKAEGDERWMWVNGSAFSNWSVFQLQDGGQCAYLNGDRISSTLCYTEKSWVCSRADGCVHWEQKAFPY
uniref:C-type lectin domain-containing protein n=1 Tax=Coturnix japonica TaxID=93934 RepID=A0A8C2SN76_COTJA